MSHQWLLARGRDGRSRGREGALGTRMRGAGRGAAVGVSLLLAACGVPDSPESRQATLGTASACPDVVIKPEGDVAALIAFGWDAGPHRWGDTVEVRVCLAGVNGTVTFRPMAGVRLDPPTLSTQPGAGNVLPFHVTIDHTTGGPLELQVTSASGRVTGGRGPTITPDGEGWRFTR